MREIRQRIIADIGINRGTCQVWARPADQQRIAVGLCPCDLRRTDRAAIPRPVLDEELLPEGGRKVDRQQTPKLVSAAPWSKGDNDLYRTDRPFVRVGVHRGPQPERSRQGRCETARPDHPVSSRCSRLRVWAR
jgi:hypothetical protein